MAIGDEPIAGYVPSLPLSIVGTSLFGLLALVFWLRFFLQGKHKYMLVLCISTTTMCVGFITRIPLTNNPTSLGTYIISTLLTLLSPCGFLALDYVLLPRLATYLDAQDALFIRPQLIARIFVTSDVVTFLTQAAGGGLTAMKNPTTANTGHWIALGALIVQGISFGTFTIMAILFGFRVRKRHTSDEKYINMVQRSSITGGTETQPPQLKPKQWKVLYGAIMWTTIGIIIRCIYRIIEFTQGYRGYIPTTEAFFYCLDSLPLFLAILVWVVVWPPRYLGGPQVTHAKNDSSRSSRA